MHRRDARCTYAHGGIRFTPPVGHVESLGPRSTASNTGAVALGSNAHSTNTGAVALGAGATATGGYVSAIGLKATASGFHGIANGA